MGSRRAETCFLFKVAVCGHGDAMLWLVVVAE